MAFLISLKIMRSSEQKQILYQSKFVLLQILFFISSDVFANNLKFEKIFNDQDEPQKIHFSVLIAVNGHESHLDVKRYAKQFIKRKTDLKSEVFVNRLKNSNEFELTALDLEKKIATSASRTNLVRIGNMVDWFELSHGLKLPMTNYELSAVPKVSFKYSKPIKDCSWFMLKTEDTRINYICWNTTNHLPMLIADSSGLMQWTIVSVDDKVDPTKDFYINTQGFVRVDANKDIDSD